MEKVEIKSSPAFLLHDVVSGMDDIKTVMNKVHFQLRSDSAAERQQLVSIDFGLTDDSGLQCEFAQLYRGTNRVDPVFGDTWEMYEFYIKYLGRTVYSHRPSSAACMPAPPYIWERRLNSNNTVSMFQERKQTSPDWAAS